MKYAVIGAGGMGIQYGVLLQEFAHKDVDFIDTWKPNVEKIREQGGAYVSQDGEDRHLVPINVYYPEEYTGQPDVWIVFLKQMQLDGVLKRCAHLFNDKQVVFSAMNGYGHFEKLNEYFVKDRIYGGTALIGLNKPVIKAHGSSDALAIRNAIRQAIGAVEADVAGTLAANIDHMVVPKEYQHAE